MYVCDDDVTLCSIIFAQNAQAASRPRTTHTANTRIIFKADDFGGAENCLANARLERACARAPHSRMSSHARMHGMAAHGNGDDDDDHDDDDDNQQLTTNVCVVLCSEHFSATKLNEMLASQYTDAYKHMRRRVRASLMHACAFPSRNCGVQTERQAKHNQQRENNNSATRAAHKGQPILRLGCCVDRNHFALSDDDSFCVRVLECHAFFLRTRERQLQRTCWLLCVVFVGVVVVTDKLI